MIRRILCAAAVVALAGCVNQVPAPGPQVASVAPPPRPAIEWPLDRADDGMHMMIAIGGVPIDFILDTGAVTSTVIPSVAVALIKSGIMRADNLKPENVTFVGAGGHEYTGWCFTLDLDSVNYHFSLSGFEMCTSKYQDLNLLGRNFLDQFSGWSINANTLTLTP